MPKKSIDGQRAEAGELQSRENSLHQIPCFLQQGRSIRQISIVIHVNAVVTVSDFQRRQITYAVAVRSLRSWTFFSTLALPLLTEYATVR